MPAYALPITYTANLDAMGSSSGIGFAKVQIDISTHTLFVDLTFRDLLGTTTAAHIHAPTVEPGTGIATVATQNPYFAGFPTGLTSGTYNNNFDMTQSSTFDPDFISTHGSVSGAELALASALTEGKAYLNIHTTAFPGGEIQGFLDASAPVPEPATIVLM
jgi:hypothetical protein